MPDYVYALHDFLPEHEDEVSFRAGERIEVVEKDDLYGDGWWQGRNLSGKVGLFPQSYTAPAPIAESVATSSSSMGAVNAEQPLAPLHGEPDSGTPPVGATVANVNTTPNGGRASNDQSDGEVMKATMTDVQQAIEQLGRAKPDIDGASFSFASTGDGRDTETDTDFDTDADRDSDAEADQDWHKGARMKLAAKARKAVEAAEKLEKIMGVGRSLAPPIEVELSDESDGEDDHHPHSLAGLYESTRQPYGIPEEDEEEVEEELGHLKDASEKTTVTQRGEPSQEEIQAPTRDETELHTATPSRTSFPLSSFQSMVATAQSRPEDVKQNGHSGFVSTNASASGSHAFTDTTHAPPLPKRMSLALKEHPIFQPSPTMSSTDNAPSQNNSLSSSARTSGPSPASTSPAAPPPNVGNPDQGLQKEKLHPSDWTMEEVVDWLRSKGFDQDVCDRFTEQEITGDVLLELDINLLKTEIGIMAFGKRMRIANAITDLRRPPSIEYSDLQTPGTFLHPHLPNTHPSGSHSRNLSHSHSHSYSYSHGYAQSVQSSGHHSFNGPSSGPFGVIMSPESAPHTGDIPGSPSPMAVALLQGPKGEGEGEGEGDRTSDGSTNAEPVEASAVGLGFGISTTASMNGRGTGRPAQLTLSPSDSALNASVKAVIDSQELDEERATMSESEAHETQTMRRRLFRRSPEPSVPGKDKEKDKSKRTSDPATSSRNSKEIVSPLSPSASPSSETTKYPGLTSAPVPRPKSRRSLDGVKTSDRLSLFSGAFGGTLGKARKPPPRYSSSGAMDTDVSEEKGQSLNLSRLYALKGPSRPSTSDGSSRFKGGFSPPKEVKETEVQRGKDPALLRKRTTSTPSTNEPNGVSMGPFKAGQSILDQIGEPDYKGWMRKKGDRYNTWKLRYFVLKGPHLYYLRSNSTMETKIKGYVNIAGYKVVADENANPGRYGFKIVHDHDKPHIFSSEEKAVVREWMKAIMKATIGRDYTKPVISSCNIPTIPLIVAQAMNPAPRPPSPGARDATQKALRRENPHQLSSRDARVLMGLPSSGGDTKDERARLDSFFKNDMIDSSTVAGYDTTNDLPASPVPPRPSREFRSPSSTTTVVDLSLVDWANSHLPASLQITDTSGSLCGGLVLLRLAESIKGRPSSPPVLDSAFPIDSNDDKLDGLFRLFDFLLDNDVKMGSVSINDVRQGKRDKIVQLLKALKSWDEKHKAIAQSVGRGSGHVWNDVPLPLLLQ